jgi:competence protein ComEC
MKSIVTRFRAYHLGTSGSSFSYFAGGHFTMIEGRLTKESRPQVEYEMTERCGVDAADVLHITSWDAHITPAFIRALEPASAKAFRNTFYNPFHISDNANDNSTVKHFRQGSFNVLSLGDVESPLIGARLRRSSILTSETDIMILAHHGADNGFTTKKFLAHIEPTVAICSSNYDNQYDHPREEIRELLHEQGIRLATTKTGDVIVRSTGDHAGTYEVVNLIGRSTKESSRTFFFSKKAGILDANGDTLRQRYGDTKRYPR